MSAGNVHGELAKKIDCAPCLHLLADGDACDQQKLHALRDIMQLLDKCQTPEHRGLNRQADVCNSVLHHDGLHVLRALKEESTNGDVAQLAGNLLERIVTQVWTH